MASSELIIFNGIKYRRYPESKRRSDQVYFTPGGGHRKAGVGRLHQEIWKAANGPIPDGYHVHHADHDPLNNDLSNLVLIKGQDHLSHHANQPDRIEWNRVNIAKAQEAARAWHGSPEGLAWHSENGKRAWEGREPQTHTCDHCGNPYESKITGAGTRFCSNACKHYARKASGVDDVDKTCEFCGEGFRANKYIRKATCSGSCGVKLGKRRRKERLAAEAALPLAA